MSADGRAQLLVRDGVRLGKIGHDAIAYIAECNLTPKAKKNIEKYLGGRSIVYYASWMDQVRHTPAYRHTNTWHTNKVDTGETTCPIPKATR